MKIENLIRDKYKNLNETEKEILRYIISNSNKIRGLRIKDLADAVFCSPNTIVRMSKKMGFTGFSEMKHVIFEELEKNFSHLMNLFAHLKISPNARFPILPDLTPVE